MKDDIPSIPLHECSNEHGVYDHGIEERLMKLRTGKSTLEHISKSINEIKQGIIKNAKEKGWQNILDKAKEMGWV